MREKLLLALCCFSALLAGCTKEPDPGAGESALIPINISGDINQTFLSFNHFIIC